MNVFRELWREWHAVPEGWRMALEYTDWALAVVWCVRTRTLINRIGEVPDLSEVRWDLCPVRAPGLAVIVPARDEAETIAPALETLLAQDYPWLQIVAVDDRSTDGTGALLDARAAAIPDRLGVIHLTEVAEGWIAKSFAMEVATGRSGSEWILFTDADVWFSPSVLRRSVAYAEMSGADHLVVAPSPVIKSRGESVVIGFLSILGVWGSRPWRVADPRARWDIAGAGAFNLLRREAWEELGGFAPQRLAVVEDLTLARRVRAAGLRQRLVFAPGLVLVHWASGAGGLIRGMTKNLFAVGNFRLWIAAGFVGGIFGLFLLPLLGLAWWRTLVPSLIVLACVAVHYETIGEVTGVEARWGWLYPLGALGVIWAMVRSVVVTLWQGGVRWRDTFYPLRELRRWNSPFVWEWEAVKRRAEAQRALRRTKPRGVQRWMRNLRRTRDGS